MSQSSMYRSLKPLELQAALVERHAVLQACWLWCSDSGSSSPSLHPEAAETSPLTRTGVYARLVQALLLCDRSPQILPVRGT